MRRCTDTDSLAALEGRIGIAFRDRHLLSLALTHRSHLGECRRHAPDAHNERLEFLGDAILEFATTEFLFRNFPDEQEGALTNRRSALVNGQTLSMLASVIGFEPLILMGKGELLNRQSRWRLCMLADALEAIIGAIYLDQGLPAAREFIDTVILEHASVICAQRRDYKSELQELVQKAIADTPHYRLLQESGPDHDRRFVTACIVGSREIGRGRGMSKRESSIAAAKDALEKLGV